MFGEHDIRAYIISMMSSIFRSSLLCYIIPGLTTKTSQPNNDSDTDWRRKAMTWNLLPLCLFVH